MKRSRRSNPGAGAARAEHPPPERPEDEKLPIHLQITYGTQHILAMYAGVITPPLIVGAAAGLTVADIGILVSAALLVSGLGTLLQTLGVWRFGARLPLVIGISFVPVATMTALADESGLPVVFGATLAAGLFGLLVAPFFAGLVRFFPPVVTGSVITVIGISLVPVAVGWVAAGAESAPASGDLALAGATLLIVLILSWVLPGVWSRMAILGGLVLGTVIAALFGRVDFSAVGDGPVFSFGQPLYFGFPEFEVAAILIMCIVMMVILTEGVADILAVGEIVGSKVDSRRLADGLRADAGATALAPLLNSFPASTFSQNVGLIALSRVSSRYAVAIGGLILIALGLFPVLGRVVAMIPMPVLGGAGLVLFGTVAAAGIRTLTKVDYDRSLNLVIVAVAIGFGVIPIAAPDFFSGFPNWLATVMHSGIVGAAILALFLNLVFNELGRRPSAPESTPPAFATPHPPVVPTQPTSPEQADVATSQKE
ncbi:purine permease [Spiractinospora alimapuensis]|uniref:nucleobase:cation symporter-2 family protein n=1 Tax=Spiractinospora alimapuensis TaxID=2820884 RepID=UPI001F26571A|nr:nucleobase:cation symporter-2 family protein [Spiractinospora alimapuensis]QVQ51816.1 purine permease [Spiractinospora alimapuensis]